MHRLDTAIQLRDYMVFRSLRLTFGFSLEKVAEHLFLLVPDARFLAASAVCLPND
jgi:hypothetical protein